MACVDTALSGSLGACRVTAQRLRRCRAPCPSPARTTRSPRDRGTCAWGGVAHPAGGTELHAAASRLQEVDSVPSVLCAAGPAAFSAGRGSPRRVGPGSGVEEAAAAVPVLVPAVPYDWRIQEQTLKPLPPPPEGVVDDPRVHNPRARPTLPCASCRVVSLNCGAFPPCRSAWSASAPAGWPACSTGREYWWTTARRSTVRCVRASPAAVLDTWLSPNARPTPPRPGRPSPRSWASRRRRRSCCAARRA